MKYTYADVQDLIKTETQQSLEVLFLRAKITYYEGNPIMDDSSFDFLETYLVSINSEVIKQVGSKRKDFNFSHPTPMLSLSKIQTEKRGEVIDYKFEEFKKWYFKCIQKIEKDLNKTIEFPTLEGTLKYDGNAINLIYKGNEFFHAITRSDRLYGKDVTDRISLITPKTLSLNVTDEDIVEIRCEVIIQKDLFDNINKQRIVNDEEMFANPRNFVAGVLGADEFDENIIHQLTLMPIHLIVNGEHFEIEELRNIFDNINVKRILLEEYIHFIATSATIREQIQYPLDGVVLAFPIDYRKILGENEHDPEWSIAIKFIPESVTSRVIYIEWNVGKTGELAPVIILEPVPLAGTIVKRASGYNAGYVIQNKLGKDAIVSIQKAGDIIPEIEKVIEQGSMPFLPQACPVCGTYTRFEENIHLVCQNDKCPGKLKKRFLTSIRMLDFKGVGPASLEKFTSDFYTATDLIVWLKTKGQTKEIEKYGFEFESRSYQKFIASFNNLKELTYSQIILLLGFDNVGSKLTDQVANEQNGLEYTYVNQDKSLVALLNNDETKQLIKESIEKLTNCGIKIIYPVKEEANPDNIYVVMTGSPKPKWETKKVFAGEFNGKVIDVDKLSDVRCSFLITDDYNSTSSKMKTAEKKEIQIISYEDFYTKFK